MKNVLLLVVVAALSSLGGFATGFRAENKQHEIDLATRIKTIVELTKVKNERKDESDYLFDKFMSGSIARQDYPDVIKFFYGVEQTYFLPLMGGPGTMLFSPISTGSPEDIPCTHGMGENEYGCNSEGYICGIKVVIDGGPLDGTWYFLRPCDGHMISIRSSVPNWDGYVIHCTDVHYENHH